MTIRIPGDQQGPRRLIAAACTVGLLACGGTPDAAPSGARQTPAGADTGSGRAPVVSVMPEQLTALAARPGARGRRIDVQRDTSTFGTGAAVVTLSSGDTLTVADSAARAWLLGDGSVVAVSGLDGAGGYENEGQSLTVIDLSSGRRRRVVADYYQIVRVELLRADGRAALLVHMRDGGQGSLHVTVVDPDRGQVFRMRNALGRIAGNRILVSGYGDGEAAVEFGDRRTPLRVDSLTTVTVGTLPLLVVPRSQP